jgi:hypothetical protein
VKRKVLFLVGFVAPFGLLIASCAPAGTPVTASNATTTPPPVKMTTPVKTTVPADTPKYGGVFTYWLKTDPMGFDEGY